MANAMPRSRTYRETAEDLAGAHRKVDPTTTTILLVPDPAQAEIRLLEVSASAPWSGDVIPFPYDPRPDLGVFFPSVIILLNPREWQDVEAGRLPLPVGWDLRAREEL
jgi:hypothetical protein